MKCRISDWKCLHGPIECRMKKEKKTKKKTSHIKTQRNYKASAIYHNEIKGVPWIIIHKFELNHRNKGCRIETKQTNINCRRRVKADCTCNHTSKVLQLLLIVPQRRLHVFLLLLAFNKKIIWIMTLIFWAAWDANTAGRFQK